MFCPHNLRIKKTFLLLAETTVEILHTTLYALFKNCTQLVKMSHWDQMNPKSTILHSQFKNVT